MSMKLEGPGPAELAAFNPPSRQSPDVPELDGQLAWIRWDPASEEWVAIDEEG